MTISRTTGSVTPSHIGSVSSTGTRVNVDDEYEVLAPCFLPASGYNASTTGDGFHGRSMGQFRYQGADTDTISVEVTETNYSGSGSGITFSDSMSADETYSTTSAWTMGTANESDDVITGTSTTAATPRASRFTFVITCDEAGPTAIDCNGLGIYAQNKTDLFDADYDGPEDPFEITGVYDPTSAIPATDFSIFAANRSASAYSLKQVVAENCNHYAFSGRVIFNRPTVGIGS